MGMLKTVMVGIGGIAIIALSAIASYTVMSLTVGKAPAPTPQSPAPVGQTTLTIKEWSVAIPLTSSIGDARYYFSPTIGQDTITVSTQRATDLLGRVTGCRTGLYGPAIQRVPAGSKMTDKKVYLVTKSYRFEEASVIEPACVAENVPQELSDILSEIDRAIEKMYEK